MGLRQGPPGSCPPTPPQLHSPVGMSREAQLKVGCHLEKMTGSGRQCHQKAFSLRQLGQASSALCNEHLAGSRCGTRWEKMTSWH